MNDHPQPDDRIAYFGRVSTPKQKLEHQWETVSRWAERHDLDIPEERRFEIKVRRHEAAAMFKEWDKRKDKPRKASRFDDLMALVEAGGIDWIVIATFDRWGISDQDEIFNFRTKLREYNVQLYSVVDNLNITATDNATFLHVAVKAVASTGYVTQQAEKNVQKMISMAEHGWATTGNAPFGLDLVLYPLTDLTKPLWRVVRTRFKPAQYRVIYYTDDSRVVRDDAGFITDEERVKVLREETTPHMPPRDKKATGYRYEPSVETRRLFAVRQMFELYDEGMGFAAISTNLWKQGFGHYDKAFGYHGCESILSNSAYVGRPAWGKVGVGEYRLCLDKQPQQHRRKPTDTLVVKKGEEHWIYPTRPLFAPIVNPALFDRVKVKLTARPHVNESFGKRRTRDRGTHPLNGKLFCPDCNKPMVLGSFMPGKKSLERSKKAKRFRCFHCGTWRKTNRAECNANTVRWDLLDAATDELLKVVSDRIEAVKTGKPNSTERNEWLFKTQLGMFLIWIQWANRGECGLQGPKPSDNDEQADAVAPDAIVVDDEDDEDDEDMEGRDAFALLDQMKERGLLDMNRPERIMMAVASHILSGDVDYLNNVDISSVFAHDFAVYDELFERETAPLKAELATIEQELEDIALELPRQRRNPTIYDKISQQAGRLEARKAEIIPKLVPMTQKARAILDQLTAIKETVDGADKMKVAELLDSFIERVEPIFDVKQVGQSKKRRTQVTGFRFKPRETASKVLPDEMEIGFSRTGTGSSPQPSRSSPGTSSSAPPARWSRGPLRAAGGAIRGCGG
jgi:hypothetical protein